MPGIVCAIRGGPNSQPTINTAISLAKDKGLPVFFVYIVNLDFLSHTQTSRVSILSEEMQELGEFILLSAQAEAEEKGAYSDGIIRQGNVEEEIINACKEFDADYVILGQPQVKESENVFDQNRLEAFKERIEKNGGVEVIFAEKGE
ncbi:MAG: hypothetical protein FVQ83_12020 [Chloroflexi bacterium]|nr:hypothetical protein [Chloroflexota bacterium]